jgi:hypothetical protein
MMTNSPNQCPRCWASLPAGIGDACPHCGASLVPAATAVGVLDRDPKEFPGRPLPPDFFASLQARTERPPRRHTRTVLVLVVAVGAGMASFRVGAADRNGATRSPARPLVAAACAGYRDFTTRLQHDGNDVGAFRDALAWFRTNHDRFLEAAHLDPKLQPAADFVVWFDGVAASGFEAMRDMSPEELGHRERPLADACYTGPGRA